MSSVAITNLHLRVENGSLTISFDPCLSEYTYKLRVSHLSTNGSQLKVLQIFNNIRTNAVVNLSDDVMSYLNSYVSNGSELVLGCVVETWDNGTLIGSSSTHRLFPLDNALPIINGTVEDTNEKTIALTGNRYKLIKYYSNAKATMTAEGQWGAAIDESLYIIRNGSNTAYSTECIFEEVESNEFTFSAQDSRGNVGRYTKSLPMIDYTKLTCNITKNRPDAVGNMTVSCVGAFFNGNFGAVENTLTVQYRYAVTGTAFSDNWADMSITKSNNSYYASANLAIPNFDQNQYYSFEIRVTDKLDTITATESGLKSMPIFHWGEDDFAFEVPVNIKGNLDVESNLSVKGDLRLKGDGNYGNSIYFGDSSYVTISEPQDDTLKIKATAVDFDTLSLGINGTPIYDYVVEQGSSQSWKYRKWNSGVAECWVTVAVATSIDVAWGCLYESKTPSPAISYPISFISRPREIATVYNNNGHGMMLEVLGNHTNTQTAQYYAVRPNAMNATAYLYFDIYVIGLWK